MSNKDLIALLYDNIGCIDKEYYSPFDLDYNLLSKKQLKDIIDGLDTLLYMSLSSIEYKNIISRLIEGLEEEERQK